MTPAKIKLGFAPTRRSIFSAPAAIEYRNLTADRLRELGVDFVDITDINKEGLLYDDNDLPKIVEKFKAEKVGRPLLPPRQLRHRVPEVARLAKEMGLPVLLWGPRDECPEPRTASACGTPSAACSPPARSSAGSGVPVYLHDQLQPDGPRV